MEGVLSYNINASYNISANSSWRISFGLVFVLRYTISKKKKKKIQHLCGWQWIMGTSVSGKGKASHSRFHLSSEGNLPGDPVVKNPPCNAGGASWGIKIPHVEQLSLHTSNYWSLMLWSPRTTREPTTREQHNKTKILCAAIKIQCNQIDKGNKRGVSIGRNRGAWSIH